MTLGQGEARDRREPREPGSAEARIETEGQRRSATEPRELRVVWIQQVVDLEGPLLESERHDRGRYAEDWSAKTRDPVVADRPGLWGMRIGLPVRRKLTGAQDGHLALLEVDLYRNVGAQDVGAREVNEDLEHRLGA